MDFRNAAYEATAVKPEQYPTLELPEIALVGRSNVGKSSLINAPTERPNLARVAATPGKTRVINFYNIDRRFYLVDLPGYGYARVSKEEKASWQEMIETYLHARRQLKLIIMLVDIRHEPSADDRLMHDWIAGQNRPGLVVASKSDKIPGGQVTRQLNMIRTVLTMAEAERLIPFSAETRRGRDEIREEIKNIVG